MADTVDYTPIRTVTSLIPKTGLLYVNRYIKMGRKRAADTATPYGLDGQELESRGGGAKFFSTRPHRPWGPPSLLYNV